LIPKCSSYWQRIRIFVYLHLYILICWSSLSSESTLAKEEEMPNKRIILESEVANPVKKVEKSM